MGKEKDVCLAVKSFFAANGIKVNDVAKRFGVKPQTITGQLSGERLFGRKNAERYAEAFGFDVVYLMTGEGSLFPGSEQSSKQEASVEIPEPIAQTLSSMSATILSQQQTIARLLSDKKNAAPRITAEGNAH